MEELIKKIMAECEKDGEPVTREEAAEMAQWELKAKKDCKRYEREQKQNKTTNRTQKIDAEKVAILESVAHQLDRFIRLDSEGGAENVKIVNIQKEITFNVGENEYSLTLTKHRKKKEK